MKFSIQRITIIVSILIVIIFSYQVYWLYGLYSSTRIKTEKAIKETMPLADHEELFMRVNKLSINTDSSDINTNISTDLDKDAIGNESYFEDDTPIQLHHQTDTMSNISILEKNISDKEALNIYIHRVLHSVIDTVLPINLTKLDSIFKSILKEQNISLSHQLVLIQNITNPNDSIQQLIENIESEYNKHYNYYYTLNKQSVLRLYTKNPAQQTLMQMIGILSTSIIIFVLLLYIFFYLIKTIRNLQTEEELKTNFTNNMTHELKTPIAVSYAAVDALLISDGQVSLDRQKKYLNIAKNQMNQLSGLVERILSMSRKNNRQIDLKKEDVNIENIISEISEKQKLVHKKEIEINKDLKVNTIHADKLHLTNIFNNLIENSIKYSGDSVQITIISKKENNNILLSVKDNGIGIDPKYMPKLFDKFYRVPTGNRHTVKGYGLGLFYVKEMILNHGGSIDVQSKTGKGTEFKIKMPQ